MTTSLTTEELTSIRNDIDDLLPDTGYVIEVTETPDGMGGNTEGTAVATDGTVTYRLDPETEQRLRVSETITGRSLQPYHRFVLTLPYDTTITSNNRFLGASADYYNITSVDDDKSWRASVRCYVERR